MPSPPIVAVEEVADAINSAASRTVPELRRVRRDLSRRVRHQPAQSVVALAEALLHVNDVPRWFAYELVHHHPQARSMLNVSTLERLGDPMSSWGEVDPFAIYLSGVAWREGLITDEDVLLWADSSSRWWRRAALVSTVPLNTAARGGEGDTARTLLICDALRTDRDDMVVKAMSWALRELAKRDPGGVTVYISENDTVLPKRVLREVRNKLETGLKNPRSSDEQQH